MMDYVSLAKSRLVGRLSKKPLVEALISALPNQLSILEQTIDQINNETSIDTAIGVQLDKLGEIVGEPRMGRPDDEYREAIKFRIFVNISKGRPSDVNLVVKTLSKGDDVQYIESYPATVYMFTDGFTANSYLPGKTQEVAPAAICDIPVAVSFGETPLRLSNVPSTNDPDSELGGLQLGVFVTLARQRFISMSGKRIRIRQDYEILPSVQRLTGVYQE